MTIRIKRLSQIAFSLGLCAVIAACAPPTSSKRDPFGQPARADYLQLVAVSDQLVEVDSAGRKIKAAAPDGLCIPIDSIQTFRDSVFMVVDGCQGAKSPLAGVVSINITNGPLAADLTSLEAHFRTVSGQVGLGYGGDEEDVSLVDLTRTDDRLYATVIDMSEFGPAFAGDEICRVFMELNGRMVVVSMMSRRAEPKSPQELRADISAIAEALRKANS